MNATTSHSATESLSFNIARILGQPECKYATDEDNEEEQEQEQAQEQEQDQERGQEQQEQEQEQDQSQKSNVRTPTVAMNPFNISATYFPLMTKNLQRLATANIDLYEQLKTIVRTNNDKFKEIPRRIGHPYQSRAPPKHKKLRTTFSKQQIALLEARFDEQKYLASEERSMLATELQMSDSQIKTWFQNRRTKWRRQEAEEKECAEKANLRLLYSQCLYLNSDYNDDITAHR